VNRYPHIYSRKFAMTTYQSKPQERDDKANFVNVPEIIRALTPILIAAIGGGIGIAVLALPSSTSPNAQSAGFGLASTAIAGAAGLAQAKSQKDE
jgi:hypothetical protein